MTDGKLTHFWIIAKIPQERYGEPTHYDRGLPWEPVAITWKLGSDVLDIEACEHNGWENIKFYLDRKDSLTIRKTISLHCEASEVENLRSLYRSLGGIAIAPMWEFLEANFKPVNGKPIEAIHHDDIITEGDT